jgi:hypothetical protein
MSSHTFFTNQNSNPTVQNINNLFMSARNAIQQQKIAVVKNNIVSIKELIEQYKLATENSYDLLWKKQNAHNEVTFTLNRLDRHPNNLSNIKIYNEKLQQLECDINYLSQTLRQEKAPSTIADFEMQYDQLCCSLNSI